jgi:anti-sigma B factor antagonist
VVGESELRVFVTRSEDRYTLKVSGQIDLATVGQFETALQLANEALERVVVVDLSEVDFIDSTGVTALMQAETSARLDVDRLQFARELHPTVEAVLRVSGIYEELQFIESQQASD